MAEPTEQDITTPGGETIHISVSDTTPDATPATAPEAPATPPASPSAPRRGHYNQATGEFTVS